MTQTAWLIEWPASDNMVTRWWNPATGWMIDANKAIWFAREQDAEAYRGEMRFARHSVVSTEHVFGLQRCPTEAEKKAQGALCGCRGSDDYCPCQNVVQPLRAKIATGEGGFECKL